MARSGRCSALRRSRRTLPGTPVTLVLTLLLSALLGTVATPARAASPQPRANAQVRISAEPLLGGKVRAGDWAAIRVHVENDGPAVDGELRIRSLSQGTATYSLPVQLPTGARQEHVLHGQVGFFGSRLTVQLVEDASTLATATVALDAIEPGQLGVMVVADRSAALLPDIRRAMAGTGGMTPRVTAIGPEDLPDDVEAWAAVDRLIWQDVSATRLSTDQLEALATWVALGGDLVILGGSAGAGALEGFPDELLPFRPESLVDASVADLDMLITTLPPGAASVPALAGVLREGTPLATSGDRTIAARMRVGQGSVTIIGFDPTVEWLSGTAAGDVLWSGVLRADQAGANMRQPWDDDLLMSALSYLPSVSLPPMDQLFLLFIGYLVLLGPVTYLVLRRLDRREWAWIMMPALALVFTAAAWLLGVTLRGGSVVVNELAVVHGATGTDRGIADAYVGVFSPTRATFDIRLPGALVSQAGRDQIDETSQAFDVLVGDPARIRDFRVGYGSLRGFRASAAVATPRVEADVRLVDDRLQGTVRNASDTPLEDVALIYGGSAQALGDLAAGQEIAVDLAAGSQDGRRLLRQLFGGARPTNAAEARTLATRLAMVRQLSGENEWGEVASASLSAQGPVLLAWRPGGALDLDLGVAADRVGDTLYLLPVQPRIAGPVTFQGGAISHALVESAAQGIYEEPGGMHLDSGTATVEYRPGGLDGRFLPTSLALALGDAGIRPRDATQPIAPLPDEQQPDQAAPVLSGTGPRPAAGVPAIQLFDRVDGRWAELAPMDWGESYAVADPARYVDASGRLLVRFVARDGQGDRAFELGVRLGGTVE